MSDSHKPRAQLIAELATLREQLAERGGGSSSVSPGEWQAESQTRAEARARIVLEHSQAIVVEFDDAGAVTYVSPELTRVLGYAPDEVVGTGDFGWVHPEDRGEVVELYHKLVGSGTGEPCVFRARHRDGGWVWLETTGTSYRSPDGTIHRMAISRDVTELRQARETLRSAQGRYRRLAENASDLIAEIDARGRFLFVSPNCQRILGYAAEEFVGQDYGEPNLISHIHPDDVKPILDAARRTEQEGSARLEYRFRRADGSWAWFDSRASTYRTERGELRAVVISRDVTDRIRAQHELRHSEERYRALAESTNDLVVELDAEGRVIYMSSNSTELLGYRPDELAETTPFGLLHPDDVERLAESFLRRVKSDARRNTGAVFRVRHGSGEWRWFQGGGVNFETPGGERRIVAVMRDITTQHSAQEERRKLETWMQQAQKFESLGVMAGGIAHDFNNLLTPILGDASLAMMDLPTDSPARLRLQNIQKAAHRAAALTNQMLDYAGQGSFSVETIDLSQLVREMQELLESAVSKQARLAFVLPAELPAVTGDAAQLNQVVMNLVTNAAEAIAEAGGRIALRTGSLEADRATLDSLFLGDRVREGTCVYFEVADTGSGMDAETRARIFDPFFTTRFTGRGLGLAAVVGIVRGHEGAIDIETEPGVGTRFRVLFPAAQPRRPDASLESRSTRSWRGSGTVLVVDDDDGVRELAMETLHRAGFRTLGAADGDEGIAVFRAHADEIDVVLLDRTMPATSGEEAFDAITALRPDARIVLISGYSEESSVRRMAGKRLAGFLQKPFLPGDLLEAIGNALSG